MIHGLHRFHCDTPRQRLQDRLDDVRFAVQHASAVRKWGARIDPFSKRVRVVQYISSTHLTRSGRAFRLRLRLHQYTHR